MLMPMLILCLFLMKKVTEIIKSSATTTTNNNNTNNRYDVNDDVLHLIKQFPISQ